MRPGWNPTRRNRHAGTKAHGHGANNWRAIPEPRHGWNLKRFYENLRSHVMVPRALPRRELEFYVEPTRPGWFYPCTLDDICTLLAGCPPEDLSSFDFIVLRQPTRKQTILSPVWGRAVFLFEIAGREGTAILLEAQSVQPRIWDASIGPERARELERLRADGHDIRKSRRAVEIRSAPHASRNTVLYRTLLHEIGHHVDHKHCHGDEWDSRTAIEMEDFAHRYAQEALRRLRDSGVVPFPSIVDAAEMERERLEARWFTAP